VGADFRALLDHAHVDFAALRFGQLFQADARSQAGRAAADDQYIVFHHFAGHGNSFIILALRAPRERLRGLPPAA